MLNRTVFLIVAFPSRSPSAALANTWYVNGVTGDEQAKTLEDDFRTFLAI